MTRLDPQRPRLRPLTTARRPAAQGPLSATVRWLAALGLCSALGCSATEAPQITTIDGARFLALRCVSQTDDGLTGLPLAGCGCTEAVGTGTDRTLRALGRVECACESLRVTATSRQLVSVNQVKASCTPVTDAAGCVTDWADCQQSPGRGVGGDWIPGDQAEAPVRFVDGVFLDGADCQTPPPRPLVPCEAAGVGQLRGYVGSAGDGRVTVLDLTAGEADDSDVDPKRVLDVDRSIPGITAVFVDDLITDVVAHPFGDFIATVNSTTGSLSLILDEGDVVPALRVELGVAPLLDAVSWPRIDAPLPAYDQTPRAWIAAPTEGLVLPIDLSRLADPMATGVLGAPIAVPGRDGSPGSPARLALSPDGALLFVGHAREPLISVVQLDAPSGFGQVVGTIELPGAACADGYLVRTLTAAEDNSCANGLDDDGDGVIDAEDPDCLDAAGSESPVPGCPKRAECADGADNDGDGLIDADDPDCQPADCGSPAECARFLDWERPLPACINGVDDDGDGLVDRADPDCVNEADNDEASAGGAEVWRCKLAETACGGAGAPAWCAQVATRCTLGSCEDGDDNDGDGLIDGADVDCSACGGSGLCREGRGLAQVGDDDPCYNGLDDDGDGLTDGEDPGCSDYNASDRFGFERTPRCSDGLDNDGDGLVDLADVGDCYAAADDSESPEAETVGPRQLLVAYVPLPTGLRRFLYVLTPSGDLSRVDLDAEVWRAQRISMPAASLSMALRQYDDEASLLVAGADTTLRSVEITAPTPILTDDGQPVFVRVTGGDADTVADAVRPYTVDEGVAVDVAPAEGSFTPADLIAETGIWRVADADTPRVFVRTARPTDAEDIRVGAPSSPGSNDLQLIAPLNERRVLHAEANVFGSAFSRTNMLTNTPRLFVNTNAASIDRSRHPVFCLPTAEGDCVPAGSTPDGSLETADAAAARDPDRLEVVPAVQVIEGDPNRLVSGTYTLAYEGELPSTESRTGLHGGQRPGTDAAGNPVETWTLVDYEADFCRRGVEVGDVVLVDRMRPAVSSLGQDPLCQPFEPVLAQNPSLAREPLRYVVTERTRRKLVLAPDTRETYCVVGDDGVSRCQLPRGAREPLPTLAPPSAVPPFVCAAQFITYRVRAGNDQWLLTGNRTGYRHPWVSQGGACVVDEGRRSAGRVGRVHLGELFTNEWFRLRLDTWAGSGGVPADAWPHLIDVAYQFDVRTGVQTRRLVDAAIVPQEMVWSPGDDRLYVVDAALATVTEIGGLSVYDSLLQVIRRLQ